MSRLTDPGGTALVAFTGKSDLKKLHGLKPGFRHCLIAIKSQAHWVVCDPLAHQLQIEVLSDIDSIDLEFWFRTQGYQIVRNFINPAPQRAHLFRPFTCVEAVKRLLGIEAVWVLTPWQLYRYLIKQTHNNRKKNNI